MTLTVRNTHGVLIQMKPQSSRHKLCTQHPSFLTYSICFRRFTKLYSLFTLQLCIKINLFVFEMFTDLLSQFIISSNINVITLYLYKSVVNILHKNVSLSDSKIKITRKRQRNGVNNYCGKILLLYKIETKKCIAYRDQMEICTFHIGNICLSEFRIPTERKVS